MAYKDPLPEVEDLLGVVINLREVESNMYERGYVEADVHWTATRWGPRRTGGLSLFETSEDVTQLRILS